MGALLKATLLRTYSSVPACASLSVFSTNGSAAATDWRVVLSKMGRIVALLSTTFQLPPVSSSVKSMTPKWSPQRPGMTAATPLMVPRSKFTLG